MALIVDFLLPRRPVSHQAKSASHKSAWRDYVFGRARQVWSLPPLADRPLKFTMVYLSEVPNPGDINNFVKPIQDALRGVIYLDDAIVLEVSAHLRLLKDLDMMMELPALLAVHVLKRHTCVYVAISDSPDLVEELKWISSPN